MSKVNCLSRFSKRVTQSYRGSKIQGISDKAKESYDKKTQSSIDENGLMALSHSCDGN